MMQAPPVSITAEQLNSAQAVFVEFQKMKQPFELCRKMLEGPQSPYVKFQAASCLKSGVIRDWNYLRGEDQKSVHLLQYLLQYVTTNPSLEPFVREQLLLVSAILLKRIGIEENATGGPVRLSESKEKDASSVVRNILLTIMNMQSAAASNEGHEIRERVHHMFVSTSFLQAVLTEYSSSTRASDFGLPWIKHLDAKKRFELKYLKDIFNLTLETLNKVIHSSPELVNRLMQQHERDITDLLLRLLQLLETMFTWNFEIITIISSQYAIQVDSIETPIFQPSIDWKDTLVNESVIQFLFFLYHEVRSLGNDSLIHHSLQCLSQFSSLTGSILASPSISLKFVQNLMSGMIGLMSRSHQQQEHVLKSGEVNSISLILYRICLHVQDRDTLKLIDKATTTKFIELFTSLTCSFLKSCMKSEKDPEEFDRFKQAVENVCDGWSVTLQAVGKHAIDHRSLRGKDQAFFDLCDGLDLVREQDSLLNSPGDMIDAHLLQGCAKEIFETYMRCHISRPEGLRKIEADEDEIAEYEEEDSVVYFDQLNAIGSIGRVDLQNSLNWLSQMLTLRIDQMQVLMERMATQGKASVSASEWTAVNEDIHWLIMISTWTLSQSSWFSDRDLIPDEVMRLSINFAADINQTIHALQSCDVGTEGKKNNIDPVVKLIVIIFKLCRMEQYVIENNMQLFSPQVSTTIASFVARFMTGFLMPNENDYKEISMTIITCFGRDSPAASQVLDFLVGHMLSKMFTWASEASLKEASAETLVQFVNNSVDRCKVILDSKPMTDKLFSIPQNNQMSCLSAQARKTIYHLLVLLASNKVQLFDQIFQPLLQKYSKLKMQVTSPADISDAHGASVIEFLECLIGISEGASPTNIPHVWSNFLAVFYTDEVPRLLDIYHNYNPVVVAILEFVSSLSNRVLCFLQNDESVRFYKCTIQVFNVYAKHNKGRVTSEMGSEEDAVQDIVLLIQILNHMASKDWIDWFPVADRKAGEPQSSDEPTITASQVIFLGLEIMMPLLSKELLEYQKLSQNYYKLMLLVCDEVDLLMTVSSSLLQAIFQSIQLALKSQ